MRRTIHKGKVRHVTPAKTGWADQWQPAGPITITKIERKECPYCKSDLVKRTGKFGEFYGCKNYPKCKFTQKIISN